MKENNNQESMTNITALNFFYGLICRLFFLHQGVALVVKNLPAKAVDVRDWGSIPGSGRSRGGGHGNPLQYSCLENPLATVLLLLSRFSRVRLCATP